MTLHDLIMIQSMFLLDTVNEILTLIDIQPNKSMFFKSFMELDQGNLIQILSFESRIIKRLLQDGIDNDIPEMGDYPLFYQMQQIKGNQIQKITPIAIALEANQVIALN